MFTISLNYIIYRKELWLMNRLKNNDGFILTLTLRMSIGDEMILIRPCVWFDKWKRSEDRYLWAIVLCLWNITVRDPLSFSLPKESFYMVKVVYRRLVLNMKSRWLSIPLISKWKCCLNRLLPPLVYYADMNIIVCCLSNFEKTLYELWGNFQEISW